MDKPIVYFAGAVKGSKVAADAIKQLIEYTTSLDVPVLSEHICFDDPTQGLADKIGITTDELTSERIEQQDIAWVDEATHLIAEISGASTGTGREIEYARVKGELGKRPAKVLCLYDVQHIATASSMIRGMTPDRYPNVLIQSYSNIEEAQSHIKNFLNL